MTQQAGLRVPAGEPTEGDVMDRSRWSGRVVRTAWSLAAILLIPAAGLVVSAGTASAITPIGPPVTDPPVVGIGGITAGGSHSCALLTQLESVRCWGANSNGQLGTMNTTDADRAKIVIELGGATAVAAGSAHTCALLNNKTVKCWGKNSSGQLGVGTTTSTTFPLMAVTGLSNVTAISAGANHTCARLMDKTVKCWGDNSSGQLGNNSLNNATTPVSVSGLSDVSAIAAGGNHTCARKSDRTVKCWGANGSGQLGNNTTTNSKVPVAVSGITTANTITAGDTHSCVVLTDKTARCWGGNGSGQLGNNSTTNAKVPVTVQSISTATAITTGGAQSCALLSDSTEKCWGSNTKGQLGIGNTIDQKKPNLAVTFTSFVCPDCAIN